MSVVDYALTTLSAVKKALKITGSTEDDNLERLINSSTDMIENFCGGRRFKKTTHANEIYDGEGHGMLFVKHYPITSITGFEYNTGTIGDPSWDSFESDLYNYDANKGIIYSSQGIPEGMMNIRLNYEAGYETIPYDLENACIELVTYLYKTAQSKGIKSEKLGDRSVTYSEVQVKSVIDDLGLDDVLASYRRINL